MDLLKPLKMAILPQSTQSQPEIPRGELEEVVRQEEVMRSATESALANILRSRQLGSTPEAQESGLRTQCLMGFPQLTMK